MSDTPDKGQDKVEEKPQEEVTASEQTQQDDLPEEASDRTRQQFEKLKQSNSQLKEKLEKLEADQQKQLVDVYESLRPKGVPELPNQSKEQIKQEDYEALIRDGYVDENVLKQSLSQLKAEAEQAKRDAKLAQERIQLMEENTQVREANQKYPQLDHKSPEFDPVFYRLVRNELVGQMIEGKKDLLLAAQEVSKVYKPNVEEKEKAQVKQQEYEKKEEQIQSQDISKGGRVQNRFSQVDADELVRATMRNQKGALAERLKRSGY